MTHDGLYLARQLAEDGTEAFPDSHGVTSTRPRRRGSAGAARRRIVEAVGDERCECLPTNRSLQRRISRRGRPGLVAGGWAQLHRSHNLRLFQLRSRLVI